MIGEQGRLQARRLLVLGAGHYQLPVIRCAQALGCHVITADYLPGNPGPALAEDHAIVSTVDMPGILRVARDYGIDGVLTYGSDVSAPTVAYVAETLALPGHPAAACARLQRKDGFRDQQRSLGLPHPAFVAGESPGDLEQAAATAGLRGRLVVKPADSSGSKGLTVLDGPAGLAAAFDTARPFSRCGVVLAEQWLAGDTYELVGDVFIQHGRLAFRQYGHNHFVPEHPVVPVGELLPALVGPSVEREIDRQIQMLVESAGLQNGCLNFDGILSDGVAYLLDVGIRNGGNLLDDLIALSTGFDLTAAAVHAALGVEYPCPELHAPAPLPAVSYILNSHAAGRFDRVTIGAGVAPYVRRVEQFVAPGDRVEPYLSGDRGLGIVLLTCDRIETAIDLLPRLQHEIVVHLR